MNTRMDKYREEREMVNSNDIPKRSDKNKELYRQVYNAYDEFENLIVPSNVKEIIESVIFKFIFCFWVLI